MTSKMKTDIFKIINFKDDELTNFDKKIKNLLLKKEKDDINYASSSVEKMAIIMEYFFYYNADISLETNEGITIQMYVNHCRELEYSSYKNYLTAVFKFISNNIKNKIQILTTDIGSEGETQLNLFKILEDYNSLSEYENRFSIEYIDEHDMTRTNMDLNNYFCISECLVLQNDTKDQRITFSFLEKEAEKKIQEELKEKFNEMLSKPIPVPALQSAATLTSK